MWDWNCEVAMCVCRVHIKIDSDFKCTFTILVPIWLQGMALTAVQGIMGKNVNDDWGERGFLWEWLLSPEWTIMTTRDTLTWGTWGWSAHGDGAILTLMMGQAEDDTPCHAIPSWHITALQRREDWPRHNRAARGNKEYQTNVFTIHSHCISQNLRKIKIARRIFHATCFWKISVYTCKQNWWSIIFHLHVMDEEEYIYVEM